MSQISLKKLCAKKEIMEVVDALIQTLGIPVTLKELDGKVIIDRGNKSDRHQENQYQITLEGEIIGWVEGDEPAKAIARLLELLASQELEKKSLAQEVLDKYRELTLFYNISDKILGIVEPEKLANLVCEEARKFIKATNGVVMLFDDSTGQLETIAGFDSDPEYSTEYRTVRPWKSDDFVYDVATSGRGKIVNDVSSYPRLVDSQLLVSSMICVPLKTKDKIIGAIALGSKTPVNYTAEDLKLLTTLASQAASAINALLHENKLKESRKEALLFRLASQIRLSLDSDCILNIALKEIRRLLQIDRCIFMWYKQANCSTEILTQPEENNCEKFSGWLVVNEASQPDMPRLINHYYAESPIGKINGWTKELLAMKMLRIDDINCLEDTAMRDVFSAQGVLSLLAVPLETRSGKIGLISCSNCQTLRPWSDDEVELLRSVAIQLAIALDQAELYQQSQTAKEIAQAKAEELHKALEDLKKAEVQLIQSEKMSSLGQTVAGVAHEINNPVNFIHGNLNYLQDYVKDLLELVEMYQQEYPHPSLAIQDAIEGMDLQFLVEDLPQILGSMKIGTERIREIVQTLRNFSRVDEAQMKSVDLHSGIDSTLVILRDRLKAKPGHPTIEVIKDYGDLPDIECYPGQLNQVFMNLLANAIDALENAIENGVIGERSPQIRIRTELIEATANPQIKPPIYVQNTYPQSDNIQGNQQPSDRLNNERAIVKIIDNGSGIPEELQKRLFDPFFTTKPVGKGTGLGLSISYQIIVEKHRGKLDCNSTLGEGTEFVISLPIKQTKPQSTQANMVESSKISKNSESSKSRIDIAQYYLPE